MSKFICIILAVLLEILFLGLAGCVRSTDIMSTETSAFSSNNSEESINTETSVSSSNNSEESINTETSVSSSNNSEESINTETSVSPSNNSAESINFEQLLRKVWIEENWDGGDIFYPTPLSFSITEIKGEKIEGKFSIDLVADSDNVLGFFTGTIKKDKANCEFDDKYGNTGTMILDFIENNKLEVSIEFTKKDPIYSVESGTYFVRPYNLKDFEKEINPLKTLSVSIELFWGNVNITTVAFTGNKIFSDAFLTNDGGDILYNFAVAFLNGTEIKDILVEDINGDGLEDVKFISAPPTTDIDSDSDFVYFEDIYFQNAKGVFDFSDRIEKDSSEM